MQRKENELSQNFTNCTINWDNKLNSSLKEWELKFQNYSVEKEQYDQISYQMQNYSFYLNETMKQQKQNQETWNYQIRALVSENPFFIEKLANENLKLKNFRHLLSEKQQVQNALLDLPIEQGKIYNVHFQVMFSGLSTQTQLGISLNNQNWTSLENEFPKLNSSYALNLADGQKIQNGTSSVYATLTGQQTEQIVIMRINTVSRSLAFTVNEVDLGLAFENIDFSAENYYPSVCLKNVGEGIIFTKVEYLSS